MLGAVGWPAELPDHVTLAPLVTLRQRFDQYACVRPAKLFAGLNSVLADRGPADVDLVVVRENSEGEYVDNGGRLRRGTPDECAVQTAIHTRRGVERILRFGFELARTRRRQLTMITKSNAQRYAYVLWDDVLDDIAGEYADIKIDKQHADAAAMNLVRRPETFDVVVASNLFGDILTDLAGTIAGGLGLAPSTNTNPEAQISQHVRAGARLGPRYRRSRNCKPDRGRAECRHDARLAGATRAGQQIRAAVEQTLAAGHKTPDLGGRLSTEEMGNRLVEAVEDVD